MLKMIGIVSALALLLVPVASAKGPIVLCGASGCASLGTETTTAVRVLPGSYDAHVAPVAPAAFFKIQWNEQTEPLAYWVPSTGVLRVLSQSGPAMWVQPRPDEIAALTQASASLQPFAAPKAAKVDVDGRIVRRGPASYLRLFTAGTRVARPVGSKGWLPVDFRGAETPWTDAYSWMWISNGSR